MKAWEKALQELDKSNARGYMYWTRIQCSLGGETILLDASCIQTVVDLGAGCSGVTACVAVQICV